MSGLQPELTGNDFHGRPLELFEDDRCDIPGEVIDAGFIVRPTALGDLTGFISQPQVIAFGFGIGDGDQCARACKTGHVVGKSSAHIMHIKYVAQIMEDIPP